MTLSCVYIQSANSVSPSSMYKQPSVKKQILESSTDKDGVVKST